METPDKSDALEVMPKAALIALNKPLSITEISESEAGLETIDIVNVGVSDLYLLCQDKVPVDDVKDIWVQALFGVDVDYLKSLFFRLQKTFIPTMACPYPVPGHIFAMIAQDTEARSAQEAEQEWQNALKEIVARFVPGIGWRGEQKPAGFFTARTYAALKVAGGINEIYNASADRLVWAKKEFIEAYKHGQ